MTTVFGARVQQARVMRGMTGKELAVELGWPVVRVSRVQRSERTDLSLAEVNDLASVLRYSSDFFLKEPTARIDESSLLFRGPKSMTKRERDRLAQTFNASADVIHVAQQQQPFPPMPLFRYGPDSSVVDVARRVREALGFKPDDSIPSMVKVLENAGIPVFMPSWDALTGDAHLGCSAWMGDYRDAPAVIVRRVGSWERVRWTYAHELGHLVMHRVAVPPDAEEAANRFANELLAPALELRRTVPQTVTLKSLYTEKMRWGISMGALIRHLADSGIITDTRKKELQTQLYTRRDPRTGNTWGRQEPGWDQVPLERPRMVMRRLEQTFATTNLNKIAAMTAVSQPPDILAGLLANQEENQAVAPTLPRAMTRKRSPVVDLASAPAPARQREQEVSDHGAANNVIPLRRYASR